MGTNWSLRPGPRMCGKTSYRQLVASPVGDGFFPVSPKGDTGFFCGTSGWVMYLTGSILGGRWYYRSPREAAQRRCDAATAATVKSLVLRLRGRTIRDQPQQSIPLTKAMENIKKFFGDKFATVSERKKSYDLLRTFLRENHDWLGAVGPNSDALSGAIRF